MIQQEFSITRTHATWKPRVCAQDIPFFHDDECNLFLGIGGAFEPSYSGTGRTLIAEMPYAHMNSSESALARNELVSLDNLPEGISFDYRLDGGFNNNCLFVSWTIENERSYRVKWICLKTFTGMQMKYVLPKKHSPLQFAFADEDAFAYCNKTPCDECAFRCKSGFVAYIAVENLGIVRMPIERISSLKLEK